MKALAGYLCHRASARLHEAAYALLSGSGPERDDQYPYWFSAPAIHVDDDRSLSSPLITLHDVAPRLAGAVDVVRRKVEQATWLAGIVAHARSTKEDDDAD